MEQTTNSDGAFKTLHRYGLGGEMKRLILLLCLIVVCSSWAFADEEGYKSVLVKTKLIRVADDIQDYLKLDLPFKVYGQNIVSNGRDITYSLRDLKLEGTEVIAKVDHKIKDQALVDKFVGTIGSKWKDVQKDADYVKHYSLTKEDALATYTVVGLDDVIVKYDGVDKDDLVKFTQWEE